MGRRRMKVAKEKARKKVNVRLAPREHAGRVLAVYEIVESLVEKHHTHLADAAIAIAWRFGWKANADGRVTLGQVKKGSDLDRELHGFDFVILLNHEAVNGGTLKQPQLKALIDHELCHCQVSRDQNGGVKTDENGRTVYRIRKHDIEEFQEIVARHGLWKDELEAFVAAVREKKDRPLLPDQEPAAASKRPATLPLGAPAGSAPAAAHTTKKSIAEGEVAKKPRGRPRRQAATA